MTTHTVKCWCDYWDAIDRGDKNFDVRLDDRGYQKSDTLILEKWDHKKHMYVLDGPGYAGKPHKIVRRISYILTGGHFGIESGYVVLGLQFNVNPLAKE